MLVTDALDIAYDEEMKPCILYIVRHGESVANRDVRCAGQRDSPLTNLGEAQAFEAKQLLADVHFDAVYSSDLQRASKTAEIISGAPVPAEHQLANLRERSFGRLEGQSDELWYELSKKFDETYGHLPLEERWQHSYADYIEGNGPLSARFLEALRSISQQHEGETVLVGTHGGCIRTTLVKLGYAEEDELPPGSFGNSAYMVLACDSQNFTIEKVTGVTLARKPAELA